MPIADSIIDQILSQIKDRGLREKILEIVKKISPLKDYCSNLNKEVSNKKIIFVGRIKILRNIMQSLCRMQKNNVLLVGDPGVGKTILVNKLAEKINNEEVPDFLKGKIIYSLNTTALIAGAGTKGELESRVEDLFDEISKKDAILFIDEIHSLVNQKSSIDLFNYLKTRPNVRIIGATTNYEYESHLHNEAAFKRRFNKINVTESTIGQSVNIVREYVKKFQTNYGITVQDQAIKTAAELSTRIFVDLKNPDKTIDIVDGACSMLLLDIQIKPNDIQSIERSIEEIKLEIEMKKIDSQDLKDSSKEKVEEEIKKLQNEITELTKEYDKKLHKWENEKKVYEEVKKINKYIFELEKLASDLKKQGKFTEASKILFIDIVELKDKLSALYEKYHYKFDYVRTILKKEDVRLRVAEQIGIPIDKLSNSLGNVKDMYPFLKANIIGQDKATKKISEQLQIGFSTFRDDKKPIASILILGMTGVGKTETAKQINYYLFGQDNLNIVNMSQYSTQASVSSLIGTSPGYVGYGAPGALTSIPKKRPYNVTLLDEIEKAHEDVQHLLLKLLDEGILEDGKNEISNFRQTVIIATSNANAQINNDGEVDYDSLTGYFKPELLNRFDLIVQFNDINKEEYKRIIKNHLDFICQKFEDNHNIKIIIDDSVISYYSNKLLINTNYGVREIKRQISKQLINKIINKIMEYKDNNYKFNSISVTMGENSNIKIEITH